jgi:hypothetical protein
LRRRASTLTIAARLSASGQREERLILATGVVLPTIDVN